MYATRAPHVGVANDLPGISPIVAQLALPQAGSYVIDAEMRVTDGRECWIATGTEETSPPARTLDLDPNPGGGVQRVRLVSATTIAAPETVVVRCHSGWEAIDDVSLIAVRVGTLHGSTDAP